MSALAVVAAFAAGAFIAVTVFATVLYAKVGPNWVRLGTPEPRRLTFNPEALVVYEAGKITREAVGELA